MKTMPPNPVRPAGFSLMEILVVIAIIVVVAAIAFPTMRAFQNRRHRAVALNNMKQLGSAAGIYTSQNDGLLPQEDGTGNTTWTAVMRPEEATVWYNALPAILRQKSVADYASNPQAFYSDENILFLPGAEYPESDRKLAQPLFAIAINTKLQRKDAATGMKSQARLQEITNPSLTVLFLEQGLKHEDRAMGQQRGYDGSPKGSAKSFVARYNGLGVVTFIDGHAELLEGKEILEPNGRIKFPVQPGEVIWSKTLEEDPN